MRYTPSGEMRGGYAPRFILAFVALLCLTLAACGDSAGETSGSPDGGLLEGQSGAGERQPGAQRRGAGEDTSAAHYYAVLDIVVGDEGRSGDIDAFWRQSFPELNADVEYVSPRGFAPYDPTQGTIPRSACIPQGADPSSLAGNAFYCPADQIIAWDEGFLQGQYRRYGDMAPVTILAHEWGHHIQRLAGSPPFSVQAELQADCYAGAYTKYADQQGKLDEGDVDEAMYALYDAGNPSYDDALWFAPNEHGAPTERAHAFNNGYISGSPAECLAYTRYKRGQTLEFGPYLLGLSPGTEYREIEEGAYQLRGPEDDAIIAWLADLPPGDAARILEERQGEWLGPRARSLGGAQPVEIDPTQGTDAVLRYESVLSAPGREELPVHGFLLLHVDRTGGGYLVDTFARGPAPETDEGWEPELQYLRILLAGIKRAG